MSSPHFLERLKTSLLRRSQALLEYAKAHPKFKYKWLARAAAPTWPPRMRIKEHAMQAVLVVTSPP